MKYDRKQIMRDAHRRRRETGVAFGDCLKAAWAFAKAPKAVAIAPQRLPLEAAVMDTVALIRKLKKSRIEVAGRISVDIGVRITPNGEAPLAYVASKQIAGGYDRRPNV